MYGIASQTEAVRLLQDAARGVECLKIIRVKGIER